MKIIRPRDFTADRAWGALDIANMGGITTRLHWTDQPYRWHVNDGSEVFLVVEGTVRMRYRVGDEEREALLEAGDAFVAHDGDAHIAEPQGACRILVVEREGSE